MKKMHAILAFRTQPLHCVTWLSGILHSDKQKITNQAHKIEIIRASYIDVCTNNRTNTDIFAPVNKKHFCLHHNINLKPYARWMSFKNALLEAFK